MHYFSNDWQMLMYPPHDIICFYRARNVTLDNVTTHAVPGNVLEFSLFHRTLTRQYHSTRHKSCA